MGEKQIKIKESEAREALLVYKYSDLPLVDILRGPDFGYDYASFCEYLSQNEELEQLRDEARNMKVARQLEQRGYYALLAAEQLLRKHELREVETVYEPELDEKGEPIYLYEHDDDGNIVYDDDGEPVCIYYKDDRGIDVRAIKMKIKSRRVRVKEVDPRENIVMLHLERAFPGVFAKDANIEQSNRIMFNMNLPEDDI